MPIKLFQLLRLKLASWFGRSIYKALVVVVFVGLALPTMVGSYLIIGVKEERAARYALNETLQRYADILALGMQDPLWVMNPEGAQPLIDSVMKDTAVLQVRVLDQSQVQFINASTGTRSIGRVLSAERDVITRAQVVGKLVIEMDDAKSQLQLREKQISAGIVLAGQLFVSLLLIIIFLRIRILQPLRKLMTYSDRLSHGDFETQLQMAQVDELGRLAVQLEQMRLAIRQLFDEVGQREERFRNIVTQVPGAVFRFRPDGPIEFVSEAIEEICGYKASVLMNGTTRTWVNIISPQDRQRQRQAVLDGLRAHKRYEVEYRIIDAAGNERWVSECGQPELSALPDASAHADAENGEDADAAAAATDAGTDSPDAPISQLRTHVQYVDGILSDISERKRDEMRIAALLTEQGAILDNVMFGIMFVRQRNIVSVNQYCEELFGYPSTTMNGRSTELIFPSLQEYESDIEEHYQAIAKGGRFSQERQFKRADDSLIWCQLNACALDPKQPDAGSIWVYADISERKRSEEKLRLGAKVFDYIADGVIVTDAAGYIVAVNPAFTQITGYTEEEAVGQTPAILRSGRQDQAFFDALWAQLLATGFWRGEIWNRRKNEELYLEWLTISAVRDGEGNCTHYVGVFSDITLIKESQEKLDHLAHHDPLTGLPNRLLFNDRLAHAIQRAGRDPQHLALLFIDLDRFKNVNDTLGHHVGDELLRQVAQALANKVRDGDTLARLGGDEFILLLEDIDGKYGAGVVADKLMSVFEQPFLVANHELFVTSSVGISIFPTDGDDVNVLIRNADVALYQAKAHGRNAYRFYSVEMTGEGVERLRLENMLRRSIEKDEIFLNFQPQVDIRSGQLVGVEALVRWHHPELGLVPPIKFIPLAEDTGFINQLGKWVLLEACRQMVNWQEAGFYVEKIAVNLSVKQFERGGIVAMVADILRETGLSAERLQLEVTESVIMNTGDALSFIKGLHAIGVGLAIDDFGTGYSSLAYLKQMPVQTLKIDRSFIKDIATDQSDEAIATAIIQLGKSMNLAVIAEGVETQEQADFLIRQGCHLAQGYLYSRPLLAQDIFERWGHRSRNGD